MTIKLDSRNARTRSDKAKDILKNSLENLGAGRSILIDSENMLIAGNGIFEQAKKLGIHVKVIESDGSELVAIKRTDLKTDDDKRKALALVDNRASDMSAFDTEMLDKLLSELDSEMQKMAGFLETIEDDLNSDSEGDKIPNELYQVVCECESEREQQQIFELLDAKGHKCRLVTL